MKFKLHHIVITLITGMLFSSCGNKMSLMKRKYNKGYYVAHSSKAIDPKQAQPTLLAKKENAIKELQVTTREPELKNNTGHQEKPLASATNVASETVKHRQLKTAVLQHSFKIVEKVAPQKIQEQIRTKAPDAGLVAATLSLFWIVLVVILVIYLLGLAFDTFGVGNIFHLLAVIFLVLLILWLLGVV